MMGLFTSCNSLLDVEPEIMCSFDNFYKTEQDLEITLYQMESFVLRVAGAGLQAGYGGIMESDFNTDNIWTPSNVVGEFGMGTADWGEHYWVIYMANVLLDNMHNAAGSVAPERLNYYRAQAYFCKAWTYFYLSREWGEVPITKNSTYAGAYAKSPLLEVLDTVIANATRAYNILPEQEGLVDRLGNALTSKQFGSKGAACALLAHAYAWKGSMIDLQELEGNSKDCYNKSIEYASLLINGEVGNYSLVRDPEKLCQLFSDNEVNNPESIFEYTLDTQSDFISSGFLFGKSYIGYPIDPKISETGHFMMNRRITYTMIDELYDKADLRRKAYFYRYSYYTLDTLESMFTEGKYTEEQRQFKRDSVRRRVTSIVANNGGAAYPYKWRAALYRTNPNNQNKLELVAIKSNYSYWRLSEIYLLRAECYVKIGENGLAETDLNEIRSFNNVKAYPNSGGDEKGLKYAVFHERERELLIEGHRFYDVVRNGMEYINTYLPGNFRTLTLTDVKDGAIFYPIHDSAFEKNAILRQNVYWAQYMK